MPNLPTVESLLQQLVQCPSINPGHAAIHNADHGEARMVALLRDILHGWADAIDIVEVMPGRSNLIATFNGHDTSTAYALEAHTDTVSVDGMTIEPFAGTIEDGRLSGRGACDTKGPMAAMLHALMRAKNSDQGLPTTWHFLAPCDEESGGLGAKHLADSGFRCDGIIVGEPTLLGALEAHKGVARFRLTVNGKAAHSAYPELGANAVHAAAAIITRIDHANNELRTSAADAPLGPPTICVSVLSGGDEVNRIPAQATMQIDCRSDATMDAEKFRALIEAAADAVIAADPALSYELVQTQAYPSFAFDKSSPFATLVNALLATTDTGYTTARYTTDAGFYTNVGIPAIVWGPGNIEQAHTADEWIDIQQLQRASDALYQVITESRI